MAPPPLPAQLGATASCITGASRGCPVAPFGDTIGRPKAAWLSQITQSWRRIRLTGLLQKAPQMWGFPFWDVGYLAGACITRPTDSSTRSTSLRAAKRSSRRASCSAYCRVGAAAAAERRHRGAEIRLTGRYGKSPGNGDLSMAADSPATRQTSPVPGQTAVSMEPLGAVARRDSWSCRLRATPRAER